jgi:hypothetical protein
LRRFIPTLVLALYLTAPAAAAAETQTAKSGDVTATVSFTRGKPDLRLTIVRARQLVLSGQAVTPPGCTGECGLAAGGFGVRPSVDARDLDGDGEPEVIVDAYTGGAHCCDLGFVYRFTGTTYAASVHDFLDAGFAITDLGGPVFVTADARFAYAFTDFADSGFPVQLFRFRAGKFVDVTRQHPAKVRADRRRWLERYHRLRRHHRDVRGVLAAYTADSYLLGERRKALRLLASANRRHDLRGGGGALWPRDRRYIRELKKLLRRLGYTAGA